jgi:hypothetical protein
MKETKIGYRYLHAHTESIAPGFENALLVASRKAGSPFSEGMRGARLDYELSIVVPRGTGAYPANE